jgi:glycosyltransferase involved in cell wall biosynthesis
MNGKANQKVALLGSHLPRQCGIATFTTDLNNALRAEGIGVNSFVVAVNDPGRRYAYSDCVRVEVAESDIDSYHRAAEYLNLNDIEVLCLQHEYGLYGGVAGANVLALLRDLRIPIVTTLHTILVHPSASQRFVMEELTEVSERVVVMSHYGAACLHDVYHVPPEKIDYIPHGIAPVRSDRSCKRLLDLEGKSVIFTFGLLSPDKGIEYMLDSLPAILERFPNTVYVVVGATHPHVKQSDGEAYRQMLENRVVCLGVKNQVQFHNRFVSRGELGHFLSAADIYVTPYLKPEQITSGTLAYALGSGKAVISTPYWYAEELLAEGRGLLVPWRDSAAISRRVIELMSDENARHAMQQRASTYTSDMAWPNVARRYVRSFQLAAAQVNGAKQLGVVHEGLTANERAEFETRELVQRPEAAQ